MKKQFALAFSAVLLISVLAGCGQGAAEDTQDTADSGALNQATVIHIATQPGEPTTIYNETAQLIEQEFEGDVEIEYISFTGGPAIMEAIAAGDIDFAITGNLPLFSSIANGTGVEAIYRGLLDEEEMHVFAKSASGIQSVDDLIGKSIGVPIGSAEHNFLGQLLDSAGYSLSDINLVNLSAEDIATALDKGEIDAGVLHEPQASIIANQVKDAETVITSSGIYETLKLLNVRTEFAEQNPELTARLVKAIIQVDQAMIADPAQTQQLLAEASGNNPEDWSCVARYQFTGEFSDAAWDAVQKSIDFLISTGAISEAFDPSVVYDGQYYARALELLADSES